MREAGQKLYNYGYKGVGNNTSTQLASVWYSNSDAFNYTYDANGNITAITHPAGYELVHYYYDALNQLIREDNYELNKTVTYTYDNGGNIRSVKEYAYTTGALGSVVKQKTYTYGDSEWKDLLTNYNGTAITYDAIGNPANWINGESFTWVEGRRLSTVTKGSNVINYTYNEDGIRTSKNVNGIRTDYYLNGTAVIMQKTGDNVIWYTYDENGLVSGFHYNDNEYYYFRNGQNDIIGIIDSSGSTVARYTYDSWGKHVSITDGNGYNVESDSSHIANINPFRYRGYYFDTETGLYYLQTRYYDANVGRFINADAYTSTGQGVIGENMFAYCLNNVINCIDLYGEWTFSMGTAFSAFFVVGITYSINLSFDSSGNIALQVTESDPSRPAKGLTTGFAGIGVSRSYSFTKLDTVADLQGYGSSLGGSFTCIEPVSIGGEILFSGVYEEMIGGSANVGVGLGAPLNVTSVVGDTTTIYKVNLPEAVEGVKTWVSNAWEQTKTNVSNACETVKTWAENAWESTTNAWENFKRKVSSWW